MNGFDGIARDYDDDFTYSNIGIAQRSQVYKYLEIDDIVIESKNILELNCGTGYDAAKLAQGGGKVIAIDASTEMIAIARERLRSMDLLDRVTLKVSDIKDLDKELGEMKFDLVFSNFGGLNCLSSSELKGMFQSLDNHLLPGGSFVAVIMSDHCCWESLYFLLKGKLNQIRRRKNSPQEVKLNQDISISTWYYNSKTMTTIVNGQYELFNTGPVGFFIPPSYMEKRIGRHKWLMNIFQYLDLFLIKNFRLKNGADHFYIHFKKGLNE